MISPSKRAASRAGLRQPGQRPLFHGKKSESPKCRSLLPYHPPLGRAETCDCLLPSPGVPPKRWGLDICIPTRNPFMNLWVKAETNAHPRIYAISCGGFPLTWNIICAARPKVNGFVNFFGKHPNFKRIVDVYPDADWRNYRFRWRFRFYGRLCTGMMRSEIFPVRQITAFDRTSAP